MSVVIATPYALCAVACKKEKKDCKHKMTYSRVREAEAKGFIVVPILNPCRKWEPEE